MSLFDLRTNVFLGSFQAAINQAQRLSPEDEREQAERDVLLYRAYCEQGESLPLVLDDIRPSSPTPLQAIRVYAGYLSGEGERERALHTVEGWRTATTTNDSTTQLVAALILLKEARLEDAFAVLYPPKSLEAQYLIVTINLQIHRVDVAVAALKVMQERADDAVPTQVARALIAIENGNPDNAGYIFQELLDKYGQSVLLLNGLAVSCIHQGEFEKAERILQDALLLDNKSVSTRLNLLVCSQHLGRPSDKYTRDFNQIATLAPQHAWVVAQKGADLLFDQARARFN